MCELVVKKRGNCAAMEGDSGEDYNITLWKSISFDMKSRRLDVDNICYVEVRDHDLIYHATSGEVITKGSMKELKEQLNETKFFQCNRCYLVNLEYVRNISARAVTMSCLTEIPLPRGKYNEVKDTYLEYAFRNRRVMV